MSGKRIVAPEHDISCVFLRLFCAAAAVCQAARPCLQSQRDSECHAPVTRAERMGTPRNAATRWLSARGCQPRPHARVTHTPSPRITLHTAPLGHVDVLVQPLGYTQAICGGRYS